MVKRSRDLVDGVSLPRIITLPSLVTIEEVSWKRKYKFLHLSWYNVVECDVSCCVGTRLRSPQIRSGGSTILVIIFWNFMMF